MSASIRAGRARVLAAALAALAALSLGACADGGNADTPPAPSSSVRATPSGNDEERVPGSSEHGRGGGTAGVSEPVTRTPADGSSGKEGSGSAKAPGSSPEASSGPSPGPGRSPAAATSATEEHPAPCTGAVSDVTARPVLKRPNYLLLTVTNIGSAECVLYGAPAIGFDHSGGGRPAPPPVIEETRPASPTVLEPGASGYAGVLLAAVDRDGGRRRTVTALVVGFSGRAGRAEPPARPVLPSGGVLVDDSLRVTYWVPDVETALY